MNATVVSRRDLRAAWTAATLPIFLWVVHLSACAALVNYVCEHPNARWTLDALTIGLAAACIPCGVISLAFARRDDRALRFVGRLGLAFTIINFLLIVWEGSYVLFLSPCRR
jgi:cytochrome c oxidase subunit IV